MLDGAMMASIVALDRDGDSTDDAETCDGGDARRAANYGAVVIFAHRAVDPPFNRDGDGDRDGGDDGVRWRRWR